MLRRHLAQPLAEPRVRNNFYTGNNKLMDRSIYCGLVRSSHIDSEVTLTGWVDRRRDHGGVIFLDLRDREGIVQVLSLIHI